MSFWRRSRPTTRRSRTSPLQAVSVTGVTGVTGAIDTEIAATVATAATVVIETGVRTTATEEVTVLMEVTTMPQPRLLRLLTKTLKPSTTTLNMRSGPPIMLKTLPKIPTQRTEVGQPSRPSTSREVAPLLLPQVQTTEPTTVKVTVRLNLPHPEQMLLVTRLLHHPRLRMPTRTERLPRHHPSLVRLPVPTARSVYSSLFASWSTLLTLNRSLPRPVCKFVGAVTAMEHAYNVFRPQHCKPD
jgi:hypothetical protein